MVVCHHLLEELEGVLRRPKTSDRVTPDEVEELVEVIRRSAITVENPVIAEAVSRDPGCGVRRIRPPSSAESDQADRLNPTTQFGVSDHLGESRAAA